MTISMYDASVREFRRMLGNLDHLLERAEADAKTRGYDPVALLDFRLYPDMYPLTRQVQIACDTAKYAVARLAGATAPSHADDERSLEALRARIATTLSFIESVPRTDVDGSEERTVNLPIRGGIQMPGLDYLLHHALPNFFFHASMTYAILRHNGVALGKRDFLAGRG